VKFENSEEVSQNLGLERRIDGEIKKFQKVPGRAQAQERPPVIAVLNAEDPPVGHSSLDRHRINPA
jgi:hypothetical protein